MSPGDQPLQQPILCLDCPAKRNALDEASILGIEHVFAGLPPDIRAVVLHGEGDPFCAGRQCRNRHAP